VLREGLTGSDYVPDWEGPADSVARGARMRGN
jgi:hypothetical protein